MQSRDTITKINGESLNPKDLFHLKVLEIKFAEIQRQLETLRGSNKYIKLHSEARIGNGINVINANEKSEFIEIFEKNAEKYSFCHFIPASGSGRRMFQDLIEFYENFDFKKESFGQYVNKNKAFELLTFFNEKRKLPFYENFKDIFSKINSGNLTSEEKKIISVGILLFDENFLYSSMKKAFLPLHRYEQEIKSAFEEQLSLFKEFHSFFKQSKLHFTVNQNQLLNFKNALKAVEVDVLKDYTSIAVDFSVQKENSHSISLDSNYDILRNEKGTIIFSPSGHGALLGNLNELNEDIIYISTIDNIPKDTLHPRILKMRKLLCGKLIYLQDKIFGFLRKIEQYEMTNGNLEEVLNFLEKEFYFDLNNFSDDVRSDATLIHKYLNRPIRVCGVLQDGEKKSGAPFWVKNGTSKSLQIVEENNVNFNIPKQKEIYHNASHLNPVEICCSIKTYTGEKFDLFNYGNADNYQIIERKFKGEKISILERSGLWNGNMEDWNTVFIEIDPDLYNPVKTVNDLLSKGHH